MPTLFSNTECPSCGYRHSFCLPDGTLNMGRAYSCVCPRTNARVTLKPDKAGEVLHHYPQGVVRMEVVEDGKR
jgi:hypothetical protein